MKHWVILLILLVFVGVSAPPPTPAQDTASKHDDDVISLDTDLVTLDLTVTDAKGDYVTDIKQNEVKVIEDGQPRGIDFFGASSQRDLNHPLACVLVLDVSGSITRDEVVLMRDSAMKFVSLVRPESLFSVVAFNQEVKVLQKFTSKANDVGKAFEKVKDVGGSTRIFDTLDQAVTMLSKSPATRGGRRLKRVVVVITDGFDNASTISPTELVRRAASAGVSVYSITLPSYIRMLNGSRERAITILDATRIVPATGGADYSADSSDFTPIFRAIAEEIASGYQVAFYPPDAKRHDGKFHEVRVEITRPGVVVKASRQGYQSPAK